MSGMVYKPKFMAATVTLILPIIEADAAVFETYDVEEMKKKYTAALVENPLDYIVDAYNEETLGISAEVEIKNTPEG